MAQVPQGISYQAIALNGSGNPVVNSNVGLRLSVLDNSASGTVLYTEIHVKTTNAQGLFNTVIGQGTPTVGTFASINWGTNSKFLKVEMDVNGGTNYVLTGSTQLLSVPYAMYAGNTASVAGSSSINDDIVDNMASNFAIHDEPNKKVYVCNGKTGTWTNQSYASGMGGPSMSISKGNLALNDVPNTIAYVYYGKTATWSSQFYTSGMGGSPMSETNGNFLIDDAPNNKVYIFNDRNGTWTSQTYVGGLGGATITTSEGN